MGGLRLGSKGSTTRGELSLGGLVIWESGTESGESSGIALPAEPGCRGIECEEGGVNSGLLRGELLGVPDLAEPTLAIEPIEPLLRCFVAEE